MELPRIIQGGMGVAVSNWKLANAVSRLGGLGVFSGTGLDLVFVRRLQDGDPGGHLRRVMRDFFDQGLVAQALEKFFIEGGRAPDQKYKSPGMHRVDAPRDLLRITVLANFCEARLAREGHKGVVGINLLEKIQLPNMASMYGAMLGGVSFVLMGAGIPSQIPGILDKLAQNESTCMRIPVDDPKGDGSVDVLFDPAALFDPLPPAPARPQFLAIISSFVLAQALQKRANGEINGWVVERHTAGGHNAPPRGAMRKNEIGEPIYGERDEMDFDKLRTLGLPFWLAGGAGKPEALRRALDLGGQGIQVGTAFAFCEDSGLLPEIRRAVLDRVVRGEASVYTDPVASPTGFPFKVVNHPGTMSEAEVYAERDRICDLGYLRSVYRKEDGTLGYRCASEPIDDYLKKGGLLEDTVGRKCLCNGLAASVGIGQPRKDGKRELPILTAGDDVVNLAPFFKDGSTSYTAEDVMRYLLAGELAPV
ncbi:MAG: nitronate monooxygenase [Candidatus Sumerlaeia bacterium]|nr:nitronate monooxygenase [Candidatus Sumerlaeia bacterium]